MPRAFSSFIATVLVPAATLAQPDQLEVRDDVPIETYLSLLAQVAQPARDGAEAYMAAFQARCGRPLKTVELRRAFAEGGGDPTLLGMVRASHQRDEATVQRLGANINCPGN